MLWVPARTMREGQVRTAKCGVGVQQCQQWLITSRPPPPQARPFGPPTAPECRSTAAHTFPPMQTSGSRAGGNIYFWPEIYVSGPAPTFCGKSSYVSLRRLKRRGPTATQGHR